MSNEKTETNPVRTATYLDDCLTFTEENVERMGTLLARVETLSERLVVYNKEEEENAPKMGYTPAPGKLSELDQLSHRQTDLLNKISNAVTGLETLL